MHIIGASGHAKVILDILTLTNVQVITVWDDNLELKSFCGHSVAGSVSKFLNLSDDQAIIAVGNNRIRKELAQRVQTTFGKAIHPKSAIAGTATLAQGCVVMANATVNADTRVGEHVIINTNASVDHDCIIGNFAHVAPQAALAGNVWVGEGTHIGIGACVLQGTEIGKWAIIGAGAVIIKDVPDFAVVVGNPGRIIRYYSM
jgi:sugar O-acyltransferase (sialic acid O-acetyltransferase NeuD family)